MRASVLQRYEALVAVRQHIHAPMVPAASAARDDVVAVPVAGPYALAHPQTAARRATQRAQAHRWAWGHVALALGAVIAGVTVGVAAPLQHALALVVLGFAMLALVVSALALGATGAGHLRRAALWLVLGDLLALATGTLLLGPEVSLFALLPGALLLTALLTDRGAGLWGIAAAFGIYALGVALSQTGALHPLLAPSAAALVWLNLALVGVGTALLLLAAHLALAHLHLALAHEAALAHRVTSLERRAHAKRIAFDADAMALQTQIARALHGQIPQTVATGEELAPLAQMINGANARLPGLLRDREERLRLERAVRDLIAALEGAWAGFTLTWPAPSHTLVDRLIPLLRPNSTQATTTLRTTR